MHSDPTGILGVIVLIAGVQVACAHPYGTLQPTGVFTADPRHPRQQLRPTGILTPDPNPQRQLRPTGIIAADPTGIYLQGPSYNRHRRADYDKSIRILDPTGTYKKHRLATGKDFHSGEFSNDPDNRRSGKDVDLGALRLKDSLTTPERSLLEDLKPTGIFALDPNPNPTPGITIYPVGKDGGPDASSLTNIQPDGVVPTDGPTSSVGNLLEGLEPTGIFAQDPNPNPAPGITIYPVDEDGGPDASRPTFIQPDGTVVIPADSSTSSVGNPLDGLKPTAIFAQDPNPNPAPGITIYPVDENGGPDASRPTFIQPVGPVVNSSIRARRQVSVPDGIYPAFGVTHTRTLNPTGVFTAGQVPDGIYPVGGITHTRTLKPTGVFTTGQVPDGIYPAVAPRPTFSAGFSIG